MVGDIKQSIYRFRNANPLLFKNKYKELANKESNVIFGGRLGNYKYYDMDKVIEAALECVRENVR